ncbi:MAG TPA: FG-GAP-like repeat-containing protein [Verrucomicrobiae bacterium]
MAWKILWACLACIGHVQGQVPGPLETASKSPALEARTLAQSACSTCHLFPEPSTLDQSSWKHEILPKMRKMMGMEPFDYEIAPGGSLLKQKRPFPAAPAMSEKEWQNLVRYYLSEAPAAMEAAPTALPAAPRPPLRGEYSAWRADSPAVSLIKIDPSNRRLYVADALSGNLLFFDDRGRLGGGIQLNQPVVHMALSTNGFFLTSIGSLYPSDEAKGEVVFFGSPKAGPVEKKSLLKNLHRPVHTLVTDINRDHREDLVVCSFGNNLGNLAWFENRGDGSYAEHILIDRPGATMTQAIDLDKDGREDLVVLMAQAWEGLYWLQNQGNGVFKEIPLLQWPPTWGSSSFQMADFNGDGHPDVLTTNGDNGDFSGIAPLKPYHGVRIYLNDGQNRFALKYFLPLNGAYKAIAADFRTTGRLDIVVSSFFPDFQKAAAKSLVYLYNEGNGDWKPVTMPESQWGRWFVMDAGDLDGDGRPELATGSYPQGPGFIPKTIFESWRKESSPVVIFRHVK